MAVEFSSSLCCIPLSRSGIVETSEGTSKAVTTVMGTITYYNCLFLSGDNSLVVDILHCRWEIWLQAYGIRYTLLSRIRSQKFKHFYFKAQPWQCRV
jgi:hypothetical protein